MATCFNVPRVGTLLTLLLCVAALSACRTSPGTSGLGAESPTTPLDQTLGSPAELDQARAASTPAVRSNEHAVASFVASSTGGRVTIVTPQFGQLGEPPFVPVADDGIAGLDRSWLVSYVATGAAHSVWVSDPDDQSRYSLDGPADQSAAARDAALYLIWNALGHVPFDYIQTAGPAWVIGRSGDSEAGVYLGELRDAVQAGGEPTSTVRPGIVYRGSDLRLRVRDSGVRLVP